MNAIVGVSFLGSIGPSSHGRIGDDDFGIQRTATADLPAADYLAVVLARALIEVLSGRRSLAQLAAHCSGGVVGGLVSSLPKVPLPLPHLLTVRVCEPVDGVAEIAVIFRRAGQVQALAFRLEGLDRRWQITAMELGLRTDGPAAVPEGSPRRAQ